MKKYILVCMVTLSLVGVANIANAATVATTSDFSKSRQFLEIILKAVKISPSDASVIVKVLNWPEYQASEQEQAPISSLEADENTDVVSSTVLQTPTPSFSIEAVDKDGYTFFVPHGNATMTSVVYEMPDTSYYNDPSGRLYSCIDSPSLSIPCPVVPGKLYEFKSSMDNYGRSTPFDMSSFSPSDSGVLMPKGTKLYYYKAIDNNGNVVEYHQ